MLLGNDLAGDKVIINPIFSDEPSDEENELENTKVFPACFVTSAMRKKFEEEESLFHDGSTWTSVVEVKHTFLSMITFYKAMVICLGILMTPTKMSV